MNTTQWNAIRDLADPLFSEGKSVNAVASKLEISWYEASKLKKDYDSRFTPTSKPLTDQQGSEPEPDEDSQPEAWDLTIQVPANRADDILATLSLQEKMDAIRHVLQLRMNAALAPEAA